MKIFHYLCTVKLNLTGRLNRIKVALAEKKRAGRAIRQRSSYDFQVGDKYDTAKFGDAAANS